MMQTGWLLYSSSAVARSGALLQRHLPPPRTNPFLHAHSMNYAVRLRMQKSSRRLLRSEDLWASAFRRSRNKTVSLSAWCQMGHPYRLLRVPLRLPLQGLGRGARQAQGAGGGPGMPWGGLEGHRCNGLLQRWNPLNWQSWLPRLLALLLGQGQG